MDRCWRIAKFRHYGFTPLGGTVTLRTLVKCQQSTDLCLFLSFFTPVNTMVFGKSPVADLRNMSFIGALLRLFSGVVLFCSLSAQGFAQVPETAQPQILGAPQGELQTLEPPVPDSALPDSGAVDVRAPGMMLPPEAGLGPADMSGQMQPAKSQEEIDAEIRDSAFNAALTGLLPLEPGEIRKTLERFDKTKEAAETPVYPYPNPEVVVMDVSLDPGTQPPLIKVAAGHVTTINVLDISGAPWPIQDITWAGNFEIVQPESGGHVVRITPMSEFAYGNMSVRLVDLDTPITFVLRTHRDGVFYRADLRLGKYGPNATPPLIDGGITIAAGNPMMTAVLDGMPPEKAQKMNVTGADGRTTAFKFENATYVRTPLTLLSPAWQASVKSADGMNVYMLGNAPVLLLSDQGRMIHARLSEKGDKK